MANRMHLQQSWTIKPGTTVVLAIESDEAPTADFIAWAATLVKSIEDRATTTRLASRYAGEEWVDVDGVGMARTALTAAKRKAS